MRPGPIVRRGVVAAAGLIGGLVAYSALSARRAERLAPRDGRFVDVEGARLHYLDMGSGPTVVLVHGLTGQLRNFTYALTEQLIGDFRVIVVDRPGSGYSNYTRPGARGLHAQAAIIGRFVEALRLDRPLLVGHSLGGALALTLATRTPDLVGGLALVSPLTQPLRDAPGIFRPLLIRSPLRRAVIAWTLAVPLARLVRRRSLKAVFGPDRVPPDFAGKGGGALSTRPGVFRAASQEVTEGVGDLEEVVLGYPLLRMPVGILFGRGDRILAPDIHGERTAATIPDADLMLIDGGHMLPLTATKEVAAWIRAQSARTPAR